MTAVCNTSPLILLAKIHRLKLLLLLYGEVILPAGVVAEVAAKPGQDAEQVQKLLEEHRFQARRASESLMTSLPEELGPGERETIALALEIRADLVVLDDQIGRRIAGERGLRVTGTVGLLVEGKERGLISSVRRDLDRLIEAGMWMHEAFYHQILLEVGE